MSAVVDEKVMTKQDVADFIKASKRQVEILVSRGRLAKPHYLGTASPRWFWSELIASLRCDELVAQPQG